MGTRRHNNNHNLRHHVFSKARETARNLHILTRYSSFHGQRHLNQIKETISGEKIKKIIFVNLFHFVAPSRVKYFVIIKILNLQFAISHLPRTTAIFLPGNTNSCIKSEQNVLLQRVPKARIINLNTVLMSWSVICAVLSPNFSIFCKLVMNPFHVHFFNQLLKHSSQDYVIVYVIFG